MAKSPVKKKKRSGIIWAIIIGLVLIVVFSVVFLGGKKKDNAVYVEKVERRDIVSSVSESGTVEPVLEVKIASDVSGEIVSLEAAEGKEVKRGDLLVSIRPDNYQSALELAQASLNAGIATELQSKATVEQAIVQLMQDSASFMRQDQLFKNKVIAKAEWENAQLKYNIAKSQLRAANASLKAAHYTTESRRANIKTAQSDLRKTNISATMDGIITRQNIRFGEKVVGTAQMEGTELFRIADLSRMQVVVKINENDIIHIHIGDSALVEVDAYENEKFSGRVSEIAYSAASASTSTDQITSFEVKVEIDPSSYLKRSDLMAGLKPNQSPFRPGMSAQVEIFTETEKNALSIPIQAVTVRKPENDATAEPIEVVFGLRDNQFADLKPVKTGISDSKYIVIKSGLAEGESIVTGPYRLVSKELETGQKVKPTEEGKIAEPKAEKEKEED